MAERELFEVVQRWCRLIISLRRRSFGRYYIYFARLGVALAIASLAPWFPSVKQLLISWFFEQATDHLGTPPVSAPSVVLWQIIISLVCFTSGIGVIIFSLLLYDRSNRNKRPGEVNNQAIAIKVQQGLTLQALTVSIADTYGATVKLDEIPEVLRELEVSAGQLSASDFFEFLKQVSLRTNPPNQITWSKKGKQFFVASETENKTDKSNNDDP